MLFPELEMDERHPDYHRWAAIRTYLGQHDRLLQDTLARLDSLLALGGPHVNRLSRMILDDFTERRNLDRFTFNERGILPRLLVTEPPEDDEPF